MNYSNFFRICFLFLVLTGCASRRGSNEAELSDYQNGLLVAKHLASEYGEVASPADVRFFSYLMSRLTQALPDHDASGVEYSIILLNTKTPMAFSPGGGFILISRGLVRQLANEAELAFVIAHEMAHQHLGHTEFALHLDENDLVDSYRIDLELEADHFAVGLMALAGYDPRVAVFAFAHAYQATGHRKHTSHPDLKERIAAVRNYIAQSEWRPPGTVDRRDFAKLRRRM